MAVPVFHLLRRIRIFISSPRPLSEHQAVPSFARWVSYVPPDFRCSKEFFSSGVLSAEKSHVLNLLAGQNRLARLTLPEAPFFPWEAILLHTVWLHLYTISRLHGS